MVNMLVKSMGKALTVVLLSTVSSIATAAPSAMMDDYVWEIIEERIYSNWGENCIDEDELEYQDCLDKSLVDYNRELIQKWQLSKYVSRELNQTIIRIPNNKNPIVLIDESIEDSEVLKYIYLLDRYDAKKNWLYLTRQVYETNNAVMVDLESGFIQEFEGSYLTVTPDMKYAATVVAEFSGEESVIIWKKDQYGRYQFDEKNNRDDDKFLQHLNFYNGSGNKPTIHKVDVEWVTNKSLLVDFYFKMNDGDTAAYRVRFNYVQPDPTSDWQIIPIK